ncbi:MAG TPA: TAT-variant-translocated molybdopterin oxidoreductase, partial [Terriglobales bacterium]|nr:TAT-variant-translocated molybdopterin oxidoreductase [Terriglobales bacterium]
MSDHDIDGSMHLHKTHEQDSHEDEQPADLTLRERPLNLAAVRAKLQSKSGKQYWRTIEELAEDPHFEDLLHREFPRQASEWDEAVDRRDFLKLMAASLAFAGLSGCKANVQTNIVPYVKQPDGLVLGKPLFFATAMPFGGDAIGVLVESHEGRPTKIEGNPDHPASLGGSDAITQASVLNLYDPDRAQTVTFAGEIRTWSAFLDAAQTMGAEIKAANGAGFRILT